ncbi:MAG: DUF1801 domain-containing protein [Alphaproteobacteria bacterium]
MAKPAKAAAQNKKSAAGKSARSTPTRAATKQALTPAQKKKAGSKAVDAYVATLEPPIQKIVNALRLLVKEAAPDALESIKWAQPVYETNGPFAFIKVFPAHVNFGFWRGAQISKIADPTGLLVGDGLKMRHVKLISASNIHRNLLQDMVRAAITLNRVHGDPTRDP